MGEQLHSTVVARELLKLSVRGLSQLKLQRLVYFAHGGYMIDHHEDGLVFDKVEAWKYGPVFRDLWDKTKYYGNETFTRINVKSADKPTDRQLKFIQEVFDVFGDLSRIQLTAMAFQDDSPWHETYASWGEKRGVIPNDLIRDYFVKISK